MIAQAFKKYEDKDDIIIFASGVSNSKTEDEKDFNREFELINLYLSKCNDETLFVYFSTCSIYDPDLKNSRYVHHKIKMEMLIKEKSKSFIIFRISNIVGLATNQNTIFNFLKFNIINNKEILIWENAERNFIEINQLVELVNLFLEDLHFWKRKIINIANFENTKIVNLIIAIEKFLSIKAQKKFIQKGSAFQIDLTDLKSVIKDKSPEFKFLSLEFIVSKYIQT